MPSLLRRLLSLVLVSSLGAMPAAAEPAGVLPGCYFWTLSYSPTDPFVDQAAPAPGPRSLYLWFMSAVYPDGMSAAEFTFRSDMPLLGFSAINGFQNLADPGHPLLAVGGCPLGPVLAGIFTVLEDADGGSACLGDPSGGTGPVLVVDCDVITPHTLPGSIRGCSSDGSAPCEVDAACTVATQPATWGRTKAGYR